jgi:hypothetical protein
MTKLDQSGRGDRPYRPVTRKLMRLYEPRRCPTCDKKVQVTIFGTYRRHLAADPTGDLRLCPASGRNALTPAEADTALRRRHG